MDSPIVIGIMGDTGVGKSSLASKMQEQAGYIPMAFATHLKQQIAAAFSVDIRLFDDRSLKITPMHVLRIANCSESTFITYMLDPELQSQDATPPGFLLEPRSPRWLMQKYSDYVKHITGNPAYYREYLFSQVYTSDVNRLCISDVRFIEEIQDIRKLYPNNTIVQLNRKNNPYQERRAQHLSDRNLCEHADLTINMAGENPAEIDTAYTQLMLFHVSRIANLNAETPQEELY